MNNDDKPTPAGRNTVVRILIFVGAVAVLLLCIAVVWFLSIVYQMGEAASVIQPFSMPG